MLDEVVKNGVPGILLSPALAFTFFAKETKNAFVPIQLDEQCEHFKHALVPLQPVFDEGLFIPDLQGWQHQMISWKPIGETITDPLLANWFSLAINERLAKESLPTEGWEQAATLMQQKELAIRLASSFTNEEDWLQQIGYNEDTMPFTISLALIEPEKNKEEWQLQTRLFSKKKPYKTVVFPDKMPKAWMSFFERVERIQKSWILLLPWLKKDNQLKTHLTEQEAWRFLTEGCSLLLEHGVNVILPSWWQSIKENKISIRASVTGTPKQSAFLGMDTLVNFQWRFATNNIELSEQDFMKLVEDNRRLINIQGQWMKLDTAFIKHVKSLMEKANKEGLHIKEVLQQALLKDDHKVIEEDNSIFDHIQIEMNEYVQDLTRRLSSIDEVTKVDVPATFNGTLRPYQEQGLSWLIHLKELGFGALLADDMGLGKSAQTIAYLLYGKQTRLLTGPALIVCPTSVLGNWQREIEKFAPSLSVSLHYGGNRKKEALETHFQEADIVLTSYALVALDEEALTDVNWSTIVLDEAQNIKNVQTKQSRAVRRLRADHKIALTGTPMENRLTELWSIFDFLNHGYLGSYTNFTRRFVSPIERDGDKERIDVLKKLIAPFLLRRTKKDEHVQLNLPDKQEQKEYCSLTVEQASLYEQLVKDTLTNVQSLNGIERRGYILMMLNKLKQICNHPALYLKEERAQRLLERSTKVEKLAELIQSIKERGESCLIFTQYIRMGDMLKVFIEKETGEEVLFLNGSVRKNDRDKMIDCFQNGEVKYFILSLKAGGTGLNLTAANHVIHFDRWWNPAVENQATDRAYRIGQKRFVHVHKLITTGTLEEKIDEMLERKQSLNDTIISSENWITELSMDELTALLGG
ncbi:MAG: DEAD/DEAH box helicase [Bacillaceae bacterium]